MKSYPYLLLAAPQWLSFQARADSLSEIAEFADEICNQSLKGSESSTSLVANLNGDVNGLANFVKRDGTRCEGIPKGKLPFRLTPLTSGPTVGLILFLSLADEDMNLIEGRYTPRQTTRQ